MALFSFMNILRSTIHSTIKPGIFRITGKNSHFRSLLICQLLFLILGLCFLNTGCRSVDANEFVRSIPFKNPDLSTIKDGTYKGSYTIAPPPCVMVMVKKISVNVHIASRRYENIEIEQRMVAEDPGWISFVSRIISKQTLEVDGVTGATYTTTAMKKAIEQALAEGNTQ